MERNRRTALLLGTFTRPSEHIKNYFALTRNAKLFDMNLKGALSTYLVAEGPFSEETKVKVFHFNDPTIEHYIRRYEGIAVVNLGPLQIPNGLEKINMKTENIIRGIVFAIRYLKAKHFDTVYIESCEHPKTVGTAVSLTLPILGPTKFNRETTICTEYFDDFHYGGELEFKKGLLLGKGQILAQQLMKSSSVTEFVRHTKHFLKGFDISIIERNDKWIRQKNMFSLLTVAKNSQERPVILELIYNNSVKANKPLILVGKATPYESSLFPLCDKPEFHKYQYRSGMGGASCIIGSMYTLCKLRASVRVHCIIAVVWNQLYDKPNKKGDVIRAMNGTSIQIDSPDAEGRLVMADALCYADTLDSSAIMDVTTLSSNVDGLIGNSYIAFFTSNENLKRILYKSSVSTGEKIWQLPFYKYFRGLLKNSVTSRISNVGSDEKSVAACKSAAFLREFVSEAKSWIHLDISAVSECRGKKNYLLDWATGRSTRLVTEFCLEYFEEFEQEI